MKGHEMNQYALTALQEARQRVEEADKARKSLPIITVHEFASLIALGTVLAALALWI